MGNYANIKFFDSDSNELNLVYDQDTELWEGVVYMPKVSVGLYETLSIYMLQEVTGSLGQTLYITPISENPNTTELKFQFQNDYNSSEDIYLYSATAQDGDIFVTKDQFQTQQMLPSTTSVSNQKPLPLRCNITLNSEVDDLHIRILNIYEMEGSTISHHIAKIRIYGETEAEDERLSVLLNNIGMELEETDYLIFKDSDIKELGTDWILMNQKRRELLLQASQIEPFIGTYKALLNAIKFFGYNNITLKEYWMNINEQSENFGKLTAVAVPNQDTKGFLAGKSADKTLPSSNSKKTSRFSLVYRLNEPTGSYDEWDIPTVKESSDFSPDEVLIKLYGLKKRLQKSFLPLQAKIVDITGEGDYFSQFNLNVWNNQHSIKEQKSGVNVHYTVFPEGRNIFIEDLRKVNYQLTGLGQDFQTISQSLREELSSSIESFYGDYYNTDLTTYNTLAGIPIGAPLILKADSLDQTWDSAEFSFEDANDTGNHMLTWENWWHRNVYEVEWIIRGPRNFYKEYRGPITEFYEFPLTLPYIGTYNIELAFYDLYNVRSVLFKSEPIEIKSKSVDVYGIYERLIEKLKWQDYNYSWNKVGATWDWSRENLSTVDDSIASLYLTMDRANYLHDESNGINFSMVKRYVEPTSPTGFAETTGPYIWRNLKQHQWNDGNEVSWEMTRVGADINSSFLITNLISSVPGGTIRITQVNPVTNKTIIDSYKIQSAYPSTSSDFAAWQNIADELNALTSIEHPLFARFNFNPLFVDLDQDGTYTGLDECVSILAVSEEPSRNYDYTDAYFLNSTNGTISGKTHFESYNPAFNDTYTITKDTVVPMLNHVTFSYDTSKMPGVVGHRWSLINNSKNVEDIYYDNQWLTYLFKDRGNYTVELQLTDLNGNINKATKNIITIN